MNTQLVHYQKWRKSSYLKWWGMNFGGHHFRSWKHWGDHSRIWTLVIIFDNGLAVCSYTNLLLSGRYWIYLLRLVSVANVQGVSDMSIFYNNTFMTERSEGLFLASDNCLILCEQIRIQNKILIKLIIVIYW